MTQFEEQWVDIPEAPDYMVSNFGEVINKLTDQTINGTRTSRGVRVHLRYRGESRSFYLHRLVAEVFLQDYDPAYEVTHKNQDKQDNCVLNLKKGLMITKPGVRRDRAA